MLKPVRRRSRRLGHMVDGVAPKASSRAVEAVPEIVIAQPIGMIMEFATVADTPKARELRRGLVDRLLAAGSITSPEVEAAFRTVPRHSFAPEASLETAYANDIVRTKQDEHGMTISSVSAPWLQAVMLEQARIGPGMRCLEIGSGGYNAALMAELVGPSGEVTTVDIDSEVTARAGRCLEATGYGRVQVVQADAEGGVPERAPYDRIIVTVGVWDLPPAWWDQLADAGRIVVPLRMRGLSRSVSLGREGDHLVSLGHQMAGFVPVRGSGAHAERLMTLHGADVGLRFDEEDQPTDVEALRTALRQPRVEAWSGIRFGATEPFDGLFLWLATILDRFGLLSRSRSDAARRLVDPASPIATPTLLDNDGFAYLTFGQVDPDTKTYEFGAFAHGPDADNLAAALVEQIRVWDQRHRHGPDARITVYPGPIPPGEQPDTRLLRKRHTTVAISWPDR